MANPLDITSNNVQVSELDSQGNADFAGTVTASELNLVQNSAPAANPVGGVYMYTMSDDSIHVKNTTGMDYELGGLISSMNNSVTVVNTTTETDLQSEVFYGGDAHVGSIYEISGYGVFSTTTGTPSLTFRAYWGGLAGTLLTSVGPIATTSNVTNAAFTYKVMVHFISSTQATAMLHVNISSSGTVGNSNTFVGVVPTFTTVSTTNQTTLDLSVQWGTASTLNTLTLLAGDFRLIS